MIYMFPPAIYWLLFLACSASGRPGLGILMGVVALVLGWTFIDHANGYPFGWWWGRTKWR